MSRTIRGTIALMLLLGAALVSGADTDPNIPASLSDWKDPAYTNRYFLKVIAPGEAGATNLQKEADVSSVILPIRMISEGGKPAKPQAMLLMAEDGSSHSLQWRQVGSDVEILFKSKPQSRRFCLYTGPLNGEPQRMSPTSLETAPLRVKMRGRRAADSFAASEAAPLTVERFQKLEDSGSEGVMPIRMVPNIDSPENPYINVPVDQFGHINAASIINPANYTAVYEGFLRAPMDGEYKFSIDTLGAAHLLIDGVPVLGAGTGDPARLPFALAKTVSLKEGMHRAVVYYADACPVGQTAISQRYFGLRLHWQPPFSHSLLCIPAQAFPRSLPAVVTRYESDKNYPAPFVQLENVGQVRAASHRGDTKAGERVQIFAKAIGAPESAILKINAAGMAEVSGAPGTPLAAWVPAGEEVKITIFSPDTNTQVGLRTVTLPALGKASQDLVDLEGELEIKSAPDFLYPDELGHIHLETMLSPAPELIFKERLESNLLPPLPRPMGEFRVDWQLGDAKAIEPFEQPEQLAVTPLDGPRRKFRVQINASEVDPDKKGKTDLMLRLAVGDVPVETLRLRVLHSTAPWPAPVTAGPDGLWTKTKYDFDDGNGGTRSEIREERVVTIVPKENESEYRKFLPLKVLERRDLGKEALFVGDPLVEGVTLKRDGNDKVGLAKAVAAAMPEFTWKSVCVPGPHRGLPVFKFISELDAFMRANGGKVPGLVVISLGTGDVSRQTPMHTFERALDALIDRLRAGGVKKVIVAGVVPEPSREKQCAPYQERLSDLLRVHHIDSVDIFSEWKNESDWVRYFSADGTEKVLGPVPNAKAREKIAQMIKDRL
jgi:hypothetical protein